MATSCCALGPYLRRLEPEPPPLDPPEDRDELDDFEPELRPRERDELDFLAEDFFTADFFAEDFLAAVFLAGAFLAAVLREAELPAERPAADLRDELELRLLLDDFLLAVLRPELLLGIVDFLP